MMTTVDKTLFMNRALELAARGRGRVEPNPMVGCVLTKDGRIVAEGFHQRFGSAHAEIEAWSEAQRRGISVADSHLHVTLEPCCHHGKMPPCTEAIIAAGIRRVTVAMVDPDPRVEGRGIQALRDAGVQVDVGELEDEATSLNAPYLKGLKQGLPWVILKWAQTIDGKIATSTGDSKWISSEPSRRYVHEMRARVDAIMVGIGTVLTDDPQLTARDVSIERMARRVVIDPRLRLPPDSSLIQSLGTGGPPLIVAASEETCQNDPTRRAKLESLGAEIVSLRPLGDGDERLSLQPLPQHMGQRYAATNVLVEGGATLLGSILKEKLADELYVFVAPKLLGDGNALGAVRGMAIEKICNSQSLDLKRLETIGDDLLMVLQTCCEHQDALCE